MERFFIYIIMCCIPLLSIAQGKVTRPIQNRVSDGAPLKKDVTKRPTSGVVNGHEWVDLGLPSGLKWATCNIGAITSNDYGEYYAWGETSSKSKYEVENSLAWNMSKNDLLSAGIINLAGCLMKSYDAASVNWGGTWRIPSVSEWEELEKRCKWEWLPNKGYKVTGPNGQSIFLPAAGYKGTVSSDIGECGYYWLNMVSSNIGFAEGTILKEDYYGIPGLNCTAGRSIRPVTK